MASARDIAHPLRRRRGEPSRRGARDRRRGHAASRRVERPERRPWPAAGGRARAARPRASAVTPPDRAACRPARRHRESGALFVDRLVSARHGIRDGLLEHVDALVRERSIGQEAGRPGRSARRATRHRRSHRACGPRLSRTADRPHAPRLSSMRLDRDRREAPGERRLGLDVRLVLLAGRRSDAGDVAARERRLEGFRDRLMVDSASWWISSKKTITDGWRASSRKSAEQ